MSDNWSWYFSSEYSRDNLLRQELGAASAAAASANRSASRLRSQLAQVQGSMEKRLDALSRAFDAYVELGDIREQLIGFGDTRMIRRDAVQAVEAMSAGLVPEPLDPGRYDSGYWLLDAMNAVIAIAAGRRDRQLEERVVALDPGSEIFRVGCAAALGHGSTVVDRLAGALASDGGLEPAQVVVADAAAGGMFGPTAMQVMAPVVERDLAAEVSDWSGWLRSSSRTGESPAQLVWLEQYEAHGSGSVGVSQAEDSRRLARPARDRERWREPAEGSAAGTPPLDDAGSRLQSLVASVIEQGSPEERELIRRAAVLRAQIEDPGASVEDSPTAPGARMLVRDLVLGWAEDDTAPAVQELARGWVRPHLAALAEQVPDVVQRPPLTVSVSHAGWRIEADRTGVDADLVRRSRASVTEQQNPTPGGVWACFVAAGVAVLVGVLSLTGSLLAGLVLVLIGLGLAGVGYWLRRRHTADVLTARQRRLSGLDEAVQRAEQRLVEQRDAQAGEDAEHHERRTRLLTRLREPERVPAGVPA